MRSVSVLIVRLVVGGFLAGHGAQKLFGWFGGQGIEGTAGWLASLRLQPSNAWARAAGTSELAGGVLTALGFLNPLGPVAGIGAMAMAWAKVHLGKPLWVTKGGAELPLTNLAVLAGLTLAGPGRLSLDSLLGIHIPRRVGFAALAAALGAVWVGARQEITAGTSELPAQPVVGGGAPGDAASHEMVGVMADTDDATEALQGGDATPEHDVTRPNTPWSGTPGADVATAGSGAYSPTTENGADS